MKPLIVSLLVLSLVVYFVIDLYGVPALSSTSFGNEKYTKNDTVVATSTNTDESTTNGTSSSTILASSSMPLVTHIQTPTHVRAVYMSSWVAGTPSIRSRLIKLIDTTELNAVVIDVKDNTGIISWDERLKDLPVLIQELHDKHIYVIGRIASFQDPVYVKLHPELAVTNITTGNVWRDRKGVPWVDTGSHDMWSYLVDVGKDAHERGFDELNYDYIRFPTDGDLKAMRFPISGTRGLTDKRGIVQEFYKYLHDNFAPLGIPISGDVFGIITTNSNETKTLGQDLGDALRYFDYVAPMVYPSHFYAGTAGFQNPAVHPREIILFSMKGALSIIEEMTTQKHIVNNGTTTATSTMATTSTYISKYPDLEGISSSTLIAKLRPWYQDFDMGAVYTKEMVRAQIDAGYDLDINSWMLWDPSNKYTPSALHAQ